MDVIHPHRVAPGRSRAAHALPCADTDTGGSALEWAEYKGAIMPCEVESCPIESGQGVENQRSGVGRIGDEVALTCQKPLQLLREFSIARRIRGKACRRTVNGHARRIEQTHGLDNARHGRQPPQGLNC